MKQNSVGKHQLWLIFHQNNGYNGSRFKDELSPVSISFIKQHHKEGLLTNELFLSFFRLCILKFKCKTVGISLRLQGKLGFPYNVKQLMVKYVLLC